MGHRDLGESIIQNTRKETTDSFDHRALNATAALIALIPVEACQGSKIKALAELRNIILPPSAIHEFGRVGWAVTWRLWPPELVTHVRRVVDSFPDPFKPCSGELHSYLCRAEHPIIYYTLDDIERAISPEALELAEMVMVYPLTLSCSANEQMAFVALVQKSLRELGLDNRTMLAIHQYMPIGGVVSETDSYPECHLNVTPDPFLMSRILLNEVVRSVSRGDHSFEFFHRQNVLWFHMPSAYQWWATGIVSVPPRQKMGQIVGAFPWMIRPVQFRSGKKRLWYWGIKLEAAAEAGMDLP